MGEDVSDMATTTSQLQAKLLALTGGKVDIMLDANTFKNSTQILREMSDAWSDMNDIQRASALELMGGKRQANVLSALIQNFDTVEKVIETSANSAGSALEENERYLDSIQGKIDQFTNATQAMWSNFLDADIVKWVVELGTNLIKIVDAIGLIPSILAAILTYKLAVGAIKMFDLTSLGTYISMLFTANSATEVQGLLINKTAFAQKLLNSTLIQAQAARMGLTAADLAGYSVTQLLTLGVKGLAAGFKNLWIAMGPVGWAILAIVAAATIFTVIFNAVNKTTEELTEELNELKSELQDIQSELDSVNSELETTNERMAELLAKDHLSFVEEKELKDLQTLNDELERKQRLLEMEEERAKKDVADKAKETLDSQMSDNADGYSWFQQLFLYGGAYQADPRNKSVEEKLDEEIGGYQTLIDKRAQLEKELENLDGKAYDKKKKKLDKLNEEIKESEDYVDSTLLSMQKTLDGVEYGYGADEELDKYYNNLYKSEISRGTVGAESDGLGHILGRPEHKAAKDVLDGWVEALKDGNKNAEREIQNIISSNEALIADINAMGLKVEDAVNYFVQISEEANFATLEGKIAEVTKAATNFESLIKGGSFNVDGVNIGLADLFDKEGKIIQTKLSQVFQETSKQTREDITYLLEGSYDQIKNGTVDVERLLSGFALKTTQQVLEIQNQVLGNQNLELFPNLKDEIEGIIDKFGEFSAAVGSVVEALDTLEQARAEEAYSGSISIETLENLMKYTDDYSQLVEIDETGAIRLAADAEQILIEQRLQKIKTDAAAAVQTAQSNLEQAKYNAKAVNETGPVQEALTAATDGLAGAWAYLGSIIGDIGDGNFKGMFERASDAYGNVTAGREEKRAQVNVSVEDAEEALANALNQQKIANALTSDNVKSKHSSNEASGGNATKEDAEEDLIKEGWDKLVSEYENKLSLITNERDLIQAEIDKMEARDGKASARYYEDLIRGSEEEKALLIQKKAALEEYLAANADSIDQDTWTDYNNEINATAVAIKECEVNTVEFAEAIREIDLHYFEQINDELGRLGEELEFVDSLLADEEVADENGNWSSAALTRMAMYTNQLELSAANAARYQDKIDELNDAYANGERSEEQYQEELANLVSEQQGAIQSYEDAKDSIVQLNEARIDAIKEGIEKEIEAYEDLISAKQEELDAERDLHDFRKSTEKQTKNIAELERRIAALSGSSAQSDVAERRKLEAQLVEAKGELNDSYYDHSRDAMSAALDDENEAYAQSKERYIERLEEQLKDQETLIQNSIMDVMINADTVYNELNALADTYGVVLSEELTQPWKDASAQAIAWKDELKESMTSGEYAALIGEGGAVTAFANGVANKLKGSWSSAKTAAENYAGYLTGTELKNKFTSTITGFGNQIQSIIDKWNGVKKAADDAYAAQTRVANVGGTGTGGGDTGNDYSPSPAKETPKTPTMNASGKNSSHIRVGKKTDALSKNKKTVGGVEYYLWSDGYYYPMSAFRVVTTDVDERGKKSSVFGFPAGTTRYKYYAKGTTGTDRDQWAITDEPQFGDELVLVPTAQGNLSYMRKGTGVVPADLTANLMEWGQFTPDSMNLGGGVNINMINNAVVKPEFNLDIESFLRCDNVSQDTLPELKKFVKEQMDSLVKQMNYSVKRYAR